MSALRTHRWSVLLACLVASLALVWSASASAAPSWTPIEIDPAGTGTATTPQVVTGADGTTAVVWTRAGTRTVVYVALRIHDAFQPAIAVSDVGSNASFPVVAVDRSGNVTVAWVSDTATITRTYFSGSGWSGPQTLSSDGASPSVAASANGGAIITWVEGLSVTKTIDAATRAEGSSTFAAGVVVSDVGNSFCPPRAAIDDAGDVAVLWQRDYPVDGTHPQWVEEASAAAAGQQFPTTAPGRTALSSTVYALGSGASSCVYQIALTAQGAAVATWDYNTGGTTPGSLGVYAATRTPTTGFDSASWSAAQHVSPLDQNGDEPSLALDPSGRATVAWQAQTDDLVEIADRPVAGVFGNPEPVGADSGVPPAITGSSGGDVTVGWSGSTNGATTLSAARRPAGGAFVPAVLGQGTTTDPYVVLSGDSLSTEPDGTVWLSYLRTVESNGSTTNAIEAQYLDEAAPSFSAVSVPGTAVAGAPTPLGATATDRISGAVSPHWSFGDGTAADGASVSHSWTAPGTYVVTITASDPSGNTTSTTRTVAVAAAPVIVLPPKLRGVAAKVAAAWKAATGGTWRVAKLVLTGVAKGDKVHVTCAGKGCTKAANHTYTVPRVRAKQYPLTALLGGVRLKTGSVLTVELTRPHFLVRRIRYAVRKGHAPKATVSCHAGGSTRVVSC